MNTVYLVTKGRYSDYSVYGVFTDKALAEEYAAQISDKWDTGCVSERKIMTQSDLPVPHGFRGYYILMDRDGNSESIESAEVNESDDDETGYPDVEGKAENGEYIHVYTGKYNFYVLTDKGEQGAVKIANERRIRMIAENKWPEKGAYEPERGV